MQKGNSDQLAMMARQYINWSFETNEQIWRVSFVIKHHVHANNIKSDLQVFIFVYVFEKGQTDHISRLRDFETVEFIKLLNFCRDSKTRKKSIMTMKSLLLSYI